MTDNQRRDAVAQNNAKPMLGEVYNVPSGMGGIFTARVVALYDARENDDGSTEPAQVHLRVDMPLNPDWHKYTFVMARAYFEQVAAMSEHSDEYWEQRALNEAFDSIVRERDDLLIERDNLKNEVISWKNRVLIAEEELREERAANGQFGVGA